MSDAAVRSSDRNWRASSAAIAGGVVLLVGSVVLVHDPPSLLAAVAVLVVSDMGLQALMCLASRTFYGAWRPRLPRPSLVVEDAPSPAAPRPPHTFSHARGVPSPGERAAILVTGGSGFLGRSIVEALARGGRDVVSLDRVECAEPIPGVRALTADMRDTAAVLDALDSVGAVVHAAFAPPQVDRDEIEAVNVGALRTLMGGAVTAGVRRVVVVSSTIVERRPRQHPLLSGSQLARLALYRDTRQRGEQVALGWSDAVSVAVCRPCTFLGPGRVGAFALLFDAVYTGGSVPVVGPGRNRYQLLHVDDLADGIVRLTGSDANGVFHFGASNVESINTHLEALIARAESSSKLVHLPARPGRLALRTVELLGMSPLSDWHQASARNEDRLVDLSRSRDELGWTPRHSNQSALDAAYGWYAATRSAGLGTPTTHAVPSSHRWISWLLSRTRPSDRPR